MKNFVLVGMPGCGKTTVGKLLAEIICADFYDMDEMIEKKHRMKVADIFKNYGENFFRQCEKECVLSLMKKENLVIASGGGAVTNRATAENLKECGVVIYIKREIEDIKKDIEVPSRPLMADGTDVLYKLYKERAALYEAIADVTVLNRTTPTQCAAEIFDLIKNKQLFPKERKAYDNTSD